jgi:hypothetical protein
MRLRRDFTISSRRQFDDTHNTHACYASLKLTRADTGHVQGSLLPRTSVATNTNLTSLDLL